MSRPADSLQPPKNAPIVKQTALEFGLPHHEHPSFLAAVRSHLRAMKGFGWPAAGSEAQRGMLRELCWQLGLGVRRSIIYGYSMLILSYYVVVCSYHLLVPNKRIFREEIGPRSAVANKLVEFWHWFHIPFKCWLCRAAGVTYELSFSRLYIRPFIFLNYEDPSQLEAYRPPGGKSRYESFQEFFTRELAEPLEAEGDAVWPCDGLLCQQGQVSDLDRVDVKGERRHVRAIFGQAGSTIPDDAWFRNVFLHNRDYHHIHCPVASVIDSVERIPGDRIVLRPWFHLDAPSRPALMNERLIVQLTAADGHRWALAIVGGPVVGSIALAHGLTVGSRIAAGDKLATFRLGSTCCFTSPVAIGRERIGDKVGVGRAL